MVERIFNIGDRSISDIMTPRPDVEWIDVYDDREDHLRTIRDCRHEQLLVGKGSIKAPLGMILKKDMLDQVLDGQPLDPVAIIRQPLAVHEATPIFKVLEQFRAAPIQLAMVLNEYGGLEGVVTQTDLLEAIAGDLSEIEGEKPDIVEQEDGSLSHRRHDVRAGRIRSSWFPNTASRRRLPHDRWICSVSIATPA